MGQMDKKLTAMTSASLFPELDASETFALDETLYNTDINVGTVTTASNVQMDWGDMFYTSKDEELRQKYPALQQAWDHYHNILNMCKTREGEMDAN